MASENERAADPADEHEGDPAASEGEIRRLASEMERRADDLERRTEELDQQIAEAERRAGREENEPTTESEGDEGHPPEQPPEIPG